MTKKIVAIWAQDENGLIGKGDRLPWSLPADLAHFKNDNRSHDGDGTYNFRRHG